MPSAKKRQGIFRVLTPGKITLYLEVLGKREDGYHNVKIALTPISLYDTLTIELRPGEGTALTLEAGEDLGPPERNLARLASEVFQQALQEQGGASQHVKLHLEKRIPAGAGLGGGSGNAAGVLSVLNRAAGHPLAPSRMVELAAELGADVTFFIDPRPSWAEGMGERLRPLDGLPPLELLVVVPPFAVSTGGAFALLDAIQLDATGAAGPAAPTAPDWKPRDAPLDDGTAVVETAVVGTVEGGPAVNETAQATDIAASLHNRFEEVLLPRYPELAEIKRRLVESGALGALLTGSGSAVYGVYAGAAGRDAALAALTDTARAAGWRCFPCRTLERHEYRELH
jgi:4-diphosphocytidyl-2-C-methyl-D-erythritol kinase